MIELYYSLNFLLIFILAYIAYEDYKTKLIHLWSFYILNIVSIVWSFFYLEGIAKYFILVYFLLIVFLDILEYFGKLPSFITNDWMIGETGIYDYWIYIFIISLFINFISKDFFLYYIGFTIAIILGVLISYFLTKKRYKKNIPLFVYGFFIISFMLVFIFIFK